MAMTLATLRTLVRQLVGDPQGSTYSLEMYQDAINFACKEYAKKTGVTYIETPVEMDIYDGTCTIPIDYMRINRVMYGTTLIYHVYPGGSPESLGRVDIPIGTYGSNTSPEDDSRYLIYDNCLLFPYPNVSLVVKSETVSAFNPDGSVIETGIVTDEVFGVAQASPRPLGVDTNVESCFSIDSYIGFGGYIDLSVIATCSDSIAEIKLRYVWPHT